MGQYSATIENLIEQFSKLPGIGARTAERLAFYLLKSDANSALDLAQAISDLKTKIQPCKECFNPTDQELCNICSNDHRNKSLICVVEQPKDLLAIESTGSFDGVYHVLMGQLDPLNGLEADDLTIEGLIDRIEDQSVTEVILATNPTVAGDGTALHLISVLEPTGVKITRLARGLATGGQIEYANKSMLSDALSERRKIS